MATSGQRAAGRDLVLLGGGHSHLFVLKQLARAPLAGLRPTLISPASRMLYSAMLPGLIAGHYTIAQTHIDLARLAQAAGARLVPGEAVGLDLAKRHVLCRDHPPVPFDILSIDIGATPSTGAVPGAAETAVPLKPIGRFPERWTALHERVTARSGRSRIGVVGAGASGIEILLAAQVALQRSLTLAGRAHDAAEFHVFSAAPDILPGHNQRVRAIFRRILAARGVHLHLDRAMIGVAPGRATTAGGAAHALDEILWATEAAAAPWLRHTGLQLDADGFIAVDATLRSISDAAIFAVGDIASSIDHPRPKAGVFAVRQGPPLADNLKRALRGEALQPFVPQRQHLSLISTGDKSAVASRGRWAAGGDGAVGRAMWRLKDHIDRRFIRAFDVPSDPDR